MIRFVIGVDEAGRGPIAGPVSVGVCAVPKAHTRSLSKFFPNGEVRDSKKLSPALREEIFAAMHSARETGQLSFAVSFTAAAVIDRRGISFAIRSALRRSLLSLDIGPSECEVLLDGSLKAPEEFSRQRTIIKGDEKEAIIALASIATKVSRDRRMRNLAKRYPQYDFDVHKGYGTPDHYKRLILHGFSPIHRRSFLKRLAKY